MKEEGHDRCRALMERITSGDTFARLIGTQLVELRVGFARASLRITEQIVNMYNMAHGGAIFSLADLSCEAAGNSLGEPAVAIQTNIQFLSAGRCGDLLTATARMTGQVGSFGLIEFEVTNQDGQLLSRGQQIVAFKDIKKRRQ